MDDFDKKLRELKQNEFAISGRKKVDSFVRTHAPPKKPFGTPSPGHTIPRTHGSCSQRWHMLTEEGQVLPEVLTILFSSLFVRLVLCIIYVLRPALSGLLLVRVLPASNPPNLQRIVFLNRRTELPL